MNDSYTEFPELSKREEDRLNKLMSVMLGSYSNNFAEVTRQVSKLIPILSKELAESSSEDLEKILRVIFNTKEVTYGHLRKFAKLMFDNDSPDFVSSLIAVMSRPSVSSDNPFADITEIALD